MNRKLLDLYSDYLLASMGPVTATGLSALVDGRLSHDQITRFLSGPAPTAKAWWLLIKPLVRRVQNEAAVLIFDDTIIEKPYTDENEIVCWHFDHSKGRNVKGINVLSALYRTADLSLPVAFECVEKTEWTDPDEEGRFTRHAKETKNEQLRRMVATAVQTNRLPFAYVVADTWFGSKENMEFIKEELGRDFVMPLKSNRKVALSLKDKLAGRWQKVDALNYQENTTQLVWLEGIKFPLLLARQVFTNADGSQGVLYLVSSNTSSLDYEQITAIYQKRWKVEEYHKSLKQNASAAKSPTRTPATQTNHLFCCLHAFVKLERIQAAATLNHFAIKARIYHAGLKKMLSQLRTLPSASLDSLATA